MKNRGTRFSLEKHFLEKELRSGSSIEKISKDYGYTPSKIKYWIKKHDLSHLAKYSRNPNGGYHSINEIPDESFCNRCSCNHKIESFNITKHRKKIFPFM